MDKLLVKDTGTGTKSLTSTCFVIGFIVACVKLLLSGLVIGGFHIPTFGGSEFSMAIAALGGVYVLRRNFGTGIVSIQTKEGKDE